MSAVDVLDTAIAAHEFEIAHGGLVYTDIEALREARDAVAKLIVERDALRVIANDFDEVLRENGFRCECGEDDCRTTRLDAVLAKGGQS